MTTILFIALGLLQLFIMKIADSHRIRANQLGLRVAELEFELHGDHSSTFRKGGTGYTPWDGTEPDPYLNHPGFDFGPRGQWEASEALRRVIESRKDDGSPIMIIQSRVHAEDVMGISAEDADILATIEANRQEIIKALAVPSHLLEGRYWHIINHKKEQCRTLHVEREPLTYEGVELPLDSTLDYSWINLSHIKGTHHHSYRCGVWAEILRVETISMRSGYRPCFKVRYSDGQIDTIAICDSENYEIK